MSADCDRFERELLPLLDAGVDRPAHLSSCDACQREWETYQRLLSQLHAVVVDGEPRVGWQQRVRAEVARQESAPVRRRMRWWLAAPVLAAAMLLLLLLRPAELEPSIVGVGITPGPVRVRGAAAHVGDTLRLTARLPARSFAELRVYREGSDASSEMVLRCASAQCVGGTLVRASGWLHPALEVAVPLSQRGVYRPVLYWSTRALAPPAGTRDADIAAIVDAGGHYAIREPLIVDD